MEQLLTIEDVLNLHRDWVTELYVDQHKTEVEIILLLEERRVIVTVVQLQACLRDWRLMETSSPERCRRDTPPSPDDDDKDVSSTKVSPSKTNKAYSLDDPENISMYNNRPLPPLPPTSTSSETSIRATNSESSSHNNDKLSLSCHHGPSSSQIHEIQTPLETLQSNGPSPLDVYTEDQQNHEMLAVGLVLPDLHWRRSGDAPSGVTASGNGSRIAKLQVRRKRREENQSESQDEEEERRKRRG